MIREALAFLMDKAIPASIELEGRQWVQQQYKLVNKPVEQATLYRDGLGQPLQLSTLRSLADLVLKSTGLTRIEIGENKVQAVFQAGHTVVNHEFQASFEAAQLPLSYPDEKQEFDYNKFLIHIDKCAERVEGYDVLRGSLTELRFIQSNVYEVKDRGVFTEVTTKGSSTIEGKTAKFEKYLTIHERVGTSEFLLPVKYLFRIDRQDITLNQCDPEADRRTFAAQARLYLEDKLSKADVIILDAA